jgi:hypothetical protein
MHGLSPTSNRLADPTGYPGKSLSLFQKAAPGGSRGLPPFDPGFEAEASRFEGLVGGKDHGSDPTIVLHFVWRRIEKPSRHTAGAGSNSAEVYLLPRVEGAGLTGNRDSRLGVGNSLRAVGVSPQTHRVDGEND